MNHAWGELDGYLFREGKHTRLYEKLGAHRVGEDVYFAVWAPNAVAVSVIGDFNGWTPGAAPLARIDEVAGIWAGTFRAHPESRYKFEIVSKHGGYRVAKADPFGRRMEKPPGTASILWDAEHRWGDAAWLPRRWERSKPSAPMSIYEVHLGSWRRVPEEGDRMLTYREVAPRLVEHVKTLGFTHVELMPVTEHAFYGSWGYQTTGYFAATARYGLPEELMQLIDALHQADVGVILDWVPGHFPTDEHGLVYFDGAPVYEHPDRRLGFHQEWNTSIFDFGRPEVRSFLISSACFWIDQYHVDGLRVDGVASMLYRDYARNHGEWIPNDQGGHEYWEAAELLKRLNAAIIHEHAGAITIAEESTAWPKVTGRTEDGGLGFTYKWDMGWMHDTLRYLARDPVHRMYHHRELTMRGLYAWSENYVLPLSHDEVVHGKGSLIRKFPKDDWQRFASLRLLLAYMFSQPGKKLLFMGAELATWSEWYHERSLDWHLLDQLPNRQISLFLGTLNHLYRTEPALHELDCEPAGFRWIEADDERRSVLAYERIGRKGARIVCVLNFVPEPHHNYRIGVDTEGAWQELLNSDAEEFGGSKQGNLGKVETNPVRSHGRELSLTVTLPPLAALFFKEPSPERDGSE